MSLPPSNPSCTCNLASAIPKLQPTDKIVYTTEVCNPITCSLTGKESGEHVCHVIKYGINALSPGDVPLYLCCQRYNDQTNCCVRAFVCVNLKMWTQLKEIVLKDCKKKSLLVKSLLTERIKESLKTDIERFDNNPMLSDGDRNSLLLNILASTNGLDESAFGTKYRFPRTYWFQIRTDITRKFLKDSNEFVKRLAAVSGHPAVLQMFTRFHVGTTTLFTRDTVFDLTDIFTRDVYLSVPICDEGVGPLDYSCSNSLPTTPVAPLQALNITPKRPRIEDMFVLNSKAAASETDLYQQDIFALLRQ
jgi:hypothetical protein